MVRADPGRLQQVIWNLLSNAVKFTPQGGSVERCRAPRRRRGDHRSGRHRLGIKRDFLPHVFDRFRQAEVGATRAHGGLGLGLAIAKQIVELHGGTISVCSEGDGQGSTFCVELPLPVSSGAEDTGEFRTLNAEPHLNDVDILLVEDESNAREVMQRLLQERGAKVRAVESAAEARKPSKCAGHGSSSATSACRAKMVMRSCAGFARGRMRQIAALAVTAFARPEDRQLALAAGSMSICRSLWILTSY